MSAEATNDSGKGGEGLEEDEAKFRAPLESILIGDSCFLGGEDLLLLFGLLIVLVVIEMLGVVESGEGLEVSLWKEGRLEFRMAAAAALEFES